MSRINTNVASLVAQQSLAANQKSLSTSLQRLSTGLRINSGADDPAGLIVSQNLKDQIAGINQAVTNSTSANNVLATAEGALNEVSNLLLGIKSLTVGAANSGAQSPSEIAADQLQVDSAIQTITRISSTTSFAGQNLIDGSLDYVTSGVNAAAIPALNIAQADLGTSPSLPVNVNVTTSAQPAELKFTASQVTNAVTLQVSGNAGTQSLTFASGTHASAIAFAVNRITDATGVSATAVNTGGAWTSGVAFKSGDYGSRQFVSVSAQKGTFATTDDTGANKKRSTGVDAVASINGATTVGDGLKLQLSSSDLDLNLTLGRSFGAGKTAFAITGGGATFQLGSEVKTQQQISIGVTSVAANKLGNGNVGYLSELSTGGDASLVGGGATKADQILSAAIDQVSELRGRIGAFQKNTLQTNIDSLNVALTNVTSSESGVADDNFAAETSNLTRAQILTQAGTSVLSTANSTPQSVLTLLQGH